MNDPSPEGWFTDPFGVHEARWLSDGTPTRLVRDHGEESYDDPPDGPPVREPERIETPPASSDNLRRADDVESAPGFDPKKSAPAAWNAFDGSPPIPN